MSRDGENFTYFCGGDAKGVSPLRKIGVSGSLILKCALRK
jgi:hypothetical protein